MLRTKVPEAEAVAEKVVEHYKGLSRAERAFRSLKSMDLKIRPIHHRLADRVRAHVFLCMLAYYVEWRLREKLAPLLHDDEDRAEAAAARRSESAKRKARTQRTDDDYPVHSFRTLLDDLATLTWNRVKLAGDDVALEMHATPTRLQQRAFDLLAIQPTA